MAESLNISESYGLIEPSQGSVPAPGEQDLCTIDTDGLITSWKSNIDQADRPCASAFVGQHHSRLFTPEDRARHRPDQVLKLAVRSGRYQGKGWRLRSDGSRYRASVMVEPVYREAGSEAPGEARRLVGFDCMMRDISEKRAPRETLRRNGQRIDLIMNSSADHATFVLDKDGIVASWSPAAEMTLGYGKRDIVGQHFSCLFCAEDLDAGADMLLLNSARAAGHFEEEGWRVKRDGRRFWARVTVDAIRDGHGECVGFTHVARDITRQRTLDELERQLMRSSDVSTTHRLNRIARSGAHPPGGADTSCDDSQVKILVVDDDPDILELATCAVQELGYPVVSAADAEAAVAILRSDPTVGLLFTDIVMPKSIDGLGLTKRARELNPALRILLTSGYPKARLQSLQEIGDGMAFISKPYAMSTLEAKLRILTAIGDGPRQTQRPVRG